MGHGAWGMGHGSLTRCTPSARHTSSLPVHGTQAASSSARHTHTAQAWHGGWTCSLLTYGCSLLHIRLQARCRPRAHRRRRPASITYDCSLHHIRLQAYILTGGAGVPPGGMRKTQQALGQLSPLTACVARVYPEEVTETSGQTAQGTGRPMAKGTRRRVWGGLLWRSGDVQGLSVCLSPYGCRGTGR